MPKLTKEALSQYIRTDCKRQLRLYLSPDNQQYRPERLVQNIPPPQPPRPGLEQIVQAGETWEADVLHGLTQTFGPAAVTGNSYPHRSGQTRYHSIPLETVLLNVRVNSFIIEAQYQIETSFERALGIDNYRAQYNLDYAEVRPDIIQVLPPGSFSRYVTPAGVVSPLTPNDTRFQLRIIDIKLTAKPSPSYFIQVVYYSMALAGWLIDHGFDHQFVVVSEAAIWPGSHEASNLMRRHHELLGQGIVPTYPQLSTAMTEDLELVPFEVFAFRVRHFLQEDLPNVLSQPWQALEWHVDNRCSTCEYVGYPWQNAQGQPTNHPDHCMPTASRLDHLSRVAFISRGASTALQSQNVNTVLDLSQHPPADPIFNLHQVLRATRTVVSGRASSLQTQQPHIPQFTGTSAAMPRWTDLHIYLSVDFDLGSAITIAFGIKAFWMEPYTPNNPNPRATQVWQPQTFTVISKSIQDEQRELIAFLNQINTILTAAQGLHHETTVQFYLWDSLQYDHLKRVIGRHLQTILNNHTIQHLAWLFPAEELLPDPDAIIRRSPLTIVRDVVRGLLAAPIPHYYTLLGIARVYHEPQLPANIAQFSVYPLFEDILSDQIPSERAHEIWARSTIPGRHWQQQMQRLDETVRRRLGALETITRRLEDDLRQTLQQRAPRINIGPPARANRLGIDSQLWYAFAKLNAALEELEVHQIRAMPPHEREARFHSARLRRRITGQQEQAILQQLNLQHIPGRRVYEMRDTSREVKLRENDFNFAVAPETVAGFLDQSLQRVIQNTALQIPGGATAWNTRMEDVTAVTVKAIDRDHLWIVLDPNSRWPTMLDDLEIHGLANLTTNVILDPVHHDYFTSKLLRALQTIGNPPNARNNPLVQRALGQAGPGARRSAHTPPADLLWDALGMHHTPVARNLPVVQNLLTQHGLGLNPTQWQAWQAALTRRLQLIWGPPGTGKSRTARAIVLGAALEAHQQGRAIRILICAATYRAMDNVLLGVYNQIRQLLPSPICETYRLRSYLQAIDPAVPPQIDVEVNRFNPSVNLNTLRGRLENNTDITLVGATPEQIHNLLRVGNNNQPQQELFDLILIDEASQMDVAEAILPLCSLANGGSVVLAGDPKQLPPIHQAQPPLDLENMVGSIYSFCREFHQVPDVMLATNYRSNSTIVDFSLNAGYHVNLSSYSPNLRLHLRTPLPTGQPINWPATLYWTPEWSELLNPDHPTVCFVYREGRSSQWNRFEADAVTALVFTLYGRLADQLRHEIDPQGNLIPLTNVAYSPADFWERAIGIVTPHRAQQGLIISQLQQVFANTGVQPSAIRDAVDTVERFQGQERDIIIASFALGDPDAIRDEDEFLMSLNRFNVMASRARAKLIVLVSQEVVDHLSSDLDTLRESGLLKVYVEAFCSNGRDMTLGFMENGHPELRIGQFKFQ